jgi:hypothetical protein
MIDVRIRDAADQVKRAQRPGIIFLDISDLLRDDGILVFSDETEIHKVLDRKLNLFLEHHERRIGRTLWRNSNMIHSAPGSVIFLVNSCVD